MYFRLEKDHGSIYAYTYIRTRLHVRITSYVDSFVTETERNLQCALAADLAFSCSLAPYFLMCPYLHPQLNFQYVHHLADATPAAAAPPCVGRDASA